MRNNYILSLSTCFLLQCVALFTNAQVTTFQKVYPIPAAMNQSGRDVLPTSDGGYLITGMTRTSIAGDTDLYMIKTDNMGTKLWEKTIGGSQPDYGQCMIPTGDGNFFILGFTLSYGSGGYDIWLLKLDPSGNTLWTKTYGGTGNEVGHEIIPTADGNFMMTGRSNNDAFLWKIDALGNTIWTQTYGGAQYETSHSVKQCSDGGYIFTGQTFTYGAGGGDVWLVKTDPLGNSSWTQTFGGIYGDEGQYILANADGTFIVDAEMSTNNDVANGSGLDIKVIKTDASGVAIWTQTYGGLDKDVTHFIQPTTDGGYLISGISRSFGWVNPDMWLVKTDGAGNTMWTRNFGSWYHDHCYVARQTADGGYIAIGHQEDNTGPGYTHVFLVKTDASGLVALEQFAANTVFSVYPNPSNGMIKIRLNKKLTSSTLKVSNALGQVLYSEVIDDSFINGEKVINLGDKEPGLYFVSVQSEKQMTTKKIVLE